MGNGLRALIKVPMPALQRLHLIFGDDFEGMEQLGLSEEEQRNLIGLFQRNLNHIALHGLEGRFKRDVMECLKKGLLERDGGCVSIALEHFRPAVSGGDSEGNDMLDIVAIANLSSLDGFAVIIRGRGLDEHFLKNVPACITS